MSPRAWLAGLCGGLLAAPVWACTVSAPPLAFGAYASPGGASVASSSTVAVDCPAILGLLCLEGGVRISLSPGNAGSYTPRRLDNGAATLAYNLFLDPAHTQIWGDGTGGSSDSGHLPLSLLGTCKATKVIYGLLPANQNVPAGSYNDTVVVTVTY